MPIYAGNLFLMRLLLIGVAGLTEHDASMLARPLTKEQVQQRPKDNERRHQPDDQQPEHFANRRMFVIQHHQCSDNMAEHWYKDDNKKHDCIKKATSIV